MLCGLSLSGVTVEESGLLQNVIFCAIMTLIMKLFIAKNLLRGHLWILVHVYSPTCLEVEGERHAPAALPTGKRLSTHCTGDWVGSSNVWTDAEDLTHTLVRSPDCPARSESQNFTLLPYHCCT
jgi:hypothetical protein